MRLLGDDADEAFRNYVQTLGENDRLSVLPTVWELYEDIKRKPRKRSRQKLKPPSSSATSNSKLWLPPCRSG